MSAERALGVVGAGAWGTALALAGVRAGAEVRLWARDPAVADLLRRTRRNERYLPGVDLPSVLEVTDDLAALADGLPLLIAVPSAHLAEALARLAPLLRVRTPLILCTKGFDSRTGSSVLDIAERHAPDHSLGLLSGPSFAAEVARGLPTAVTLACPDSDATAAVIARLAHPVFRIYPTDDVVGVEIGGAVKNVLAIACGVADGRGLGDNARAALITRGLTEVMRLGQAMGARTETLVGLAGLGDLVLTCTSGQSRNYALGRALGRGLTLAAATAEARGVAEGVATAAALAHLAAVRGVELPIVEAVNAVLHHGALIEDAISALLSRPFPTAPADAITGRGPRSRNDAE